MKTQDIDAYFSVASSWLERFPELWCVTDFQQCLSAMLQIKQVRVNEPKREVLVYDRFHDWMPVCISPNEPSSCHFTT